MSEDDSYDSDMEEEEEEEESGDEEEDNEIFKVRTAKEVLEKPIEEIRNVNDVFQISGVVARQLLRHYKWKSERLVSRYFNGERDKLFKEAQIPSNLSDWKKPTSKIECSICWDECVPEKITGLPCNHFFCNECYREYLEVLITKTAASGGIKCPAKQCKLEVDELTVLSLLPKKGKATDLYYMLAVKEFIKDTPQFKPCAGGECNNIIEFHKESHPEMIPIVDCTCGTKTCWDCGRLDHSPASCKMFTDWVKKTDSDSQTQNWIKLYTKACPNKSCGTIITKDGGCQYMRCRKCNHAFCWLCLGAFDHKNHNCNAVKLDPNADKAARDLAKYEHFSKRYASHAQSITFQSKLKDKVEKLMLILNKQYKMRWNEVQFAKKARETVILARRMLKDTYIYGYYMPKGVNPQLFEFIQGELESNTEKLTGFLEGDPKIVAEKHLQIKDLSIALEKNIKSVVTDLYKGAITGGAETKKVWEPVKKVGYDGWIYNA